jgi:hypothetical protein
MQLRRGVSGFPDSVTTISRILLPLVVLEDEAFEAAAAREVLAEGRAELSSGVSVDPYLTATLKGGRLSSSVSCSARLPVPKRGAISSL